MFSGRSREASAEERDAAPAAKPSAPAVPGAGRSAALARAVSEGALPGNRAFARMLLREEGYGYGVADDPLNTGGFGDASLLVRPGPVRTTTIGSSAGAPAPAPAAEAPVAEPAPAAPLTRGQVFRAEIVKALNRFYEKEAVEGTPEFDTFLTPESVAADRAASPGWTSCIACLGKIFNDAASVVNKMAGLKLNKKGHWEGGGLAKFAARSDAEKIARPLGAWVEAPALGSKTPRPQAGDILVLHHEVRHGEFSHVDFVHSVVARDDGTEVWTTIDGGQGSMGTWKDKVDANGAPVLNAKGKPVKEYVKGSGKQVIKRRERIYWPDAGLIEGEPSQNPDPKTPGKKWVHGWVNVENLVIEETV